MAGMIQQQEHQEAISVESAVPVFSFATSDLPLTKPDIISKENDEDEQDDSPPLDTITVSTSSSSFSSSLRAGPEDDDESTSSSLSCDDNEENQQAAAAIGQQERQPRCIFQDYWTAQGYSKGTAPFYRVSTSAAAAVQAQRAAATSSSSSSRPFPPQGNNTGNNSTEKHAAAAVPVPLFLSGSGNSVRRNIFGQASSHQQQYQQQLLADLPEELRTLFYTESLCFRKTRSAPVLGNRTKSAMKKSNSGATNSNATRRSQFRRSVSFSNQVQVCLLPPKALQVRHAQAGWSSWFA